MNQATAAAVPVRVCPFVFAILALSNLTSLAAQPADRVFEGTAQVVEVQVPVNVTDRDGNPVRGLTAKDFAIFEGGEEQEITDFRVVDLEIVEPGTTRTEIERAVPAAARRHVLLLFDLSFSTPAAIVRARIAAREFVLNELFP